MINVEKLAVKLSEKLTVEEMRLLKELIELFLETEEKNNEDFNG
jgi:hypothetical protein